MVNCRNRRLVSLLLSKLLAYNWKYLARFSTSKMCPSRDKENSSVVVALLRFPRNRLTLGK